MRLSVHVAVGGGVDFLLCLVLLRFLQDFSLSVERLTVYHLPITSVREPVVGEPRGSPSRARFAMNHGCRRAIPSFHPLETNTENRRQPFQMSRIPDDP